MNISSFVLHELCIFKDPNEDTEWNDVLRSKGIIPAKQKEAEITEDQIVSILEQTIEQKQNDSKYSCRK